MRGFMLLFAATTLVLSTTAAQADLGDQLAKLLPNDGSRFDHFGISVAIDGATAIVGAQLGGDDDSAFGSAYLFDVATGHQVATLLANDGAQHDRFGISVGISGTTVIVGAFLDDENGADSGSAYVFDITTGWLIDKLLPGDGAIFDRFGVAVAISGTIAIVGAYRDDDNGIDSGSAYLFDTTTGQQIAKLLAADGAGGDQFGVSLAISGTTAIVGANYDDDNGAGSGSAYLFDISDLRNPVQTFKLLPVDGAAQDLFGTSVAISGTTTIVGAYGDDDNGNLSGSSYLFDTATGQQIAKLLPDDGEARDSSGISVAISGATAIIGAWFDDDNGEISGSAYLFDTATGQQIAKLLPSDGAELDLFGHSVAISGTIALAGAFHDDENGENSGSAYLFDAAVASPCPEDSDGDGMVTICHTPPGNPDNAHTITVGVNAVPAHLAHGDQCGPCEEDGGLLISSGGDAGLDECPGDVDDSGDVDAADLAELLGVWGPNPSHATDLDGDGQVGPHDLALLLGGWGPCE